MDYLCIAKSSYATVQVVIGQSSARRPGNAVSRAISHRR